MAPIALSVVLSVLVANGAKRRLERAEGDAGIGHAWADRGRQRIGLIQDNLAEGEEVTDHGLIRLRRGRRWVEGYMLITDRRLMFVAPPTILSLFYDGVENFRGFRKIATADLFVDIDGKRLRFNGSKLFVFLVSRTLTQQRAAR
jgi:hypothetical protein